MLFFANISGKLRRGMSKRNWSRDSKELNHLRTEINGLRLYKKSHRLKLNVEVHSNKFKQRKELIAWISTFMHG